jgi:hypothetical protein
VISLFFGVHATGKNPSVNDPTYDYVDEKFPTVGYEAAGGNVIFSGDTYHEAVLYHSVGPSASKAEGAGAHIYDDASFSLLPGDESSNHPIYEDPTLSQVKYNHCYSNGLVYSYSIHVCLFCIYSLDLRTDVHLRTSLRPVEFMSPLR